MLMQSAIGPVSAIVFISSFLIPPVFAQTTVSYSPGDPFTLDPGIGNPNQNFGTVHVESDSSAGWSLQVRSQRHSVMRHSSIGINIRYDLEVNGNTINNLSSGNDVTVLSNSRMTCVPPDGCDYAVRGRILAGEIDGKPAGAYSDTLIFTLINRQ